MKWRCRFCGEIIKSDEWDAELAFGHVFLIHGELLEDFISFFFVESEENNDRLKEQED